MAYSHHTIAVCMYVYMMCALCVCVGLVAVEVSLQSEETALIQDGSCQSPSSQDLQTRCLGKVVLLHPGT